MREVPPVFNILSMTAFGFELNGAGLAQALFDEMCVQHGDGDRYSWDAADGIRKYQIQRGKGVAYVGPYPINIWSLTIDAEDTRRTVSIDCINLELTDEQGNPCSNQLANEVFRATKDAEYKRREEDKNIPYLVIGDTALTANQMYEPPANS